MVKIKKGFTLIELLIVISIVALLSGVILTSLSSSRIKARNAAFKGEMDSLSKGLLNVCVNSSIVDADITDGKTFSKANVLPALTQNCGSSGFSTFSVTITPTNGSSCTSATLSQDGAAFIGC